MISQPQQPQPQQAQQPQQPQQPQQQIPPNELISFKSNLTQWLEMDRQISELNQQMKELKNIKNKTLEPLITQFMVQYNIKDVNTDNGPVKCNQRNTKKPLNKNIIRDSLSQLITDSIMIDQAMTLIDQREIKTTYRLVGPK